MKLNKKGMTLFELLAVIVILGIVAAIGFPMVNGLIENTRKDSIVANANSFLNAAVTEAKSDYVANSYTTQEVYFITIGTPTDTAPSGASTIQLDQDFKDGIVANVTITISDSGVTVVSSNITYKENGYTVANAATGITNLVRNDANKD